MAILLFTTPYSAEHTDTAIKLARAALHKGHHVTLFAYGDGVHNFTVGQKAKGVPNAQLQFEQLIAEGLSVELCGTCLIFRGIPGSMLLQGAKPSGMLDLCELMDTSDIFIAFT